MTRGDIDREAVRRHLVALDTALQYLRRYQGTSTAALVADQELLWAVERGLQRCAQNVLDISTHLVAGAGRDTPDYATALDELGRLGVLPPEFVARFRGVAGFRNVLVHAYLEVDIELVRELLVDRLGDFVDYARYVEAYLARGA